MAPRLDETTVCHPLPRRLGVFTATLIVVASMVGTGAFTTTGLLLAEIHSPGAVLLAWLLGGVFALCGALTYGELAPCIMRHGAAGLLMYVGVSRHGATRRLRESKGSSS